ncbi:FG-GAP-like repeat-containing protein [Aquimarina agarilytica]|uniref:FG-GAP-like repeat-containing protein n=1 Tax=Aquimarina agarilytica TaxID=1087449 RepID=UPI0002884A62|nr:FG-GAP-like repeat-containing protein [Aquimarina agarilytica]
MKRKTALFFFLTTFLSQFLFSQVDLTQKAIQIGKPLRLTYKVTEQLTNQFDLVISTKAAYANLTLVSQNQILIDHLDIPSAGAHQFKIVATFENTGEKQLEFRVTGGDVILESLYIHKVENLELPTFNDISRKAGLDRVNSIKYGGPTIADINNDGYYDFIVNNHNEETNKLYWNNGDGTVSKDEKKLSKWYRHDLHGSSAADFDNDGDLDILLSQGGGNGTSPSLPTFYRNDNETLVLATKDIEIAKGARGRAIRWSDMDKDGDLDLILVNARSIKKDELPQHLFYRNKGDGTFEDVRIAGIENFNAERVLVTDLNGDQIDDVVLYASYTGLSIWQGNGDFSFTDITSQLDKGIANTKNITGATDIDIDNDGDFDLYLTRGLVFGVGAKPSLDFNPLKNKMDIKLQGHKGVTEMDFTAENDVMFSDLRLARRKFNAPYPIYLGKNKEKHIVKDKSEFKVVKSVAQGFPDDMSANGIYIGNTNGDQWKIALVRNDYIFWNFGFSMEGISSVTPKFELQNRNVDDLLLLNDNGVFKNVANDWHIQKGGNHQGVTTSDFNNDGFQDLFVYRWGDLKSRPSDYMLLNNGKNKFVLSTNHKANDLDDEGHGDMGQAFDFDLDGDIDMLSGSDDEGMWYLYENKIATATNNFAMVRVNYSPKSNVDPMGAVVILETATGSYKKRVGSVGEVFSQSLLNTVHFGLGKEKTIKRIKVTWRNGETVVFKNKKANQLFSTDKIDPSAIKVTPSKEKVRVNTHVKLVATASAKNENSDVIWSSSNAAVASVDANGVVTAHESGKKVTITAKSKVTNVTNKAVIKTVDFYPIAMESIAFKSVPNKLVVGEEFALEAIVAPKYTDNQNIVWSSSDDSIATLNNEVIKALKVGKVKIYATAEENEAVRNEFEFEVAPYVEPHIVYDNEDNYKNLSRNDELKVNVTYHAGSRRKMIKGDHGGIKFWFREFTADWKFIKDVTTVVETPLNTVEGKVSGTLSLKALKPSSELPKGNFYLLNVSFVSSDGKTYDKNIYPINLD